MTSLPINTIGATGIAVSALGLGCGSLGNLYRVMDDATARATVDAALNGGIGYVDTAPHYGQGLSERRLGSVIAGRAGLTVSSKVGRILDPIAPPPPGTERHGFIDGDPFEPVFDYSHDGVMRSFESSLKRLNRDSIDILLTHDLGRATHGDAHPAHMKAFLDGGYKAMRGLKDQGLIRAIGLGVNEWQVCEEVMDHADLDVVLLAGRYTLLEQTALDSFLPRCERTGVSVIVGGPFNSGVLSGGTHYNYGAVPAGIAKRVAALNSICRAHNVPLAAAALQFPLAHPSVVSVVAGMASPDEVRTNLDLFATPIPSALWEALKNEGLLHPATPLPATEAMLS